MEFNNLKKKLEKLFFRDNVKKILLYSLINNSFYDFLSSLDIINISSILDKIYKKELELIGELKKENDEFKKYELALELENYFLLIELITEKSVFSNNLIIDFKREFGEDYLKVIEEIDNNQVVIVKESLLNNYLLIKEWQDRQNSLGRLVISNLMNDVKYFYKDEKDYIFYKLREKKILDMDILSNLFHLLDRNEMLSLIGGKCYGLVKLYINKIPIPITYSVLTNTNISLEDIEFLDKDMKYSVRSSATIEDGDNRSFAGMFETFLDVKYEDLLDKIDRVKESVNSIQVKTYMNENGLSNTNMAVVIQKFVKVDYSGVWFGINEKEGIYEYIDDIGEKLVSGSTSAFRVRFKESDKYFLDNINIGETFIKIQNIFHGVCDLEWCIINGQLYVLQYRAITKSIDLFDDEEVMVNENSIKGLGVSSGEMEGNIYYFEKFDDSVQLKENSILLTNKTDVSWMGILNNVRGLITFKGSLLCHAAIIARELGIPCVTDLSKKDYDKLKSAQVVKMNGKTGIIDIIN